uniref:Uncharacterized protein n=1 Tax=Panagrolaimus sp. ES5 TaxID=591445 RepID=A0AC34GT24_9BILA
MEKVNLSNNEIEVLCSPLHWLRIKYLNLSNNKISSIDLPEENEDEKNIVAEDSPGVHLNLSGNNLTSLPFKFEKIIQIVSLNLSKNKFEYDSAEECLYQRLPLTLKKLNVSEMPLISLSCTLCYRMLKELVASNCQLRYICPKISHQFFHTEPFDIQRNLKLNITQNPDLEGLPFVPDTIIPYPKKHDKIVKSATFWRQMESEINTFKVLTFPSFQNTERLAFKMEFNSLMDKKNAKYYCKCCAKCGRDTKEDIFQQIMTMDFDVFETTEKEKILNYWASGTWKANVVSRLCDGCKNEYKNDVKELLTSKKRKQQEKKRDAKKQRVVKILPQQNAVIAEMPESSKLQYYPDSNGCSSQTAPVMFPPALSSQTMQQYHNTAMDYEMSNANYPSQSFQNMQLQFSNNFIPPQNSFPMPPQKTSFISLPPLRFTNGYHESQQQCIEIQNMETVNPENTYTNL